LDGRRDAAGTAKYCFAGVIGDGDPAGIKNLFWNISRRSTIMQ
jgi:hypothetical protein